jgi:hypothetical protein
MLHSFHVVVMEIEGDLDDYQLEHDEEAVAEEGMNWSLVPALAMPIEMDHKRARETDRVMDRETEFLAPTRQSKEAESEHSFALGQRSAEAAVSA